MYAIKAMFDGENFIPKQPIPVNGKCEVIITFMEHEDKDNNDVDDDIIYLLKPDLTKKPVLGRLNGLIKIPDDFDSDEPLGELLFALSTTLDISYFDLVNAKGYPAKLGGWEGKIKMADDFNAPLDDFEDYM